MSSCRRQGRGVVLLLITTMLWGCAIMFAAIIITQLPERKKGAG